MVNMCCVPTCNSTSYTPEVTLFTFTANQALKKIWLEKIRSNPATKSAKNQKAFSVKKHTKICSEHFLKSDIKFGSDRHRLKPEAVPSIFPWTITPKTKAKAKKRGRCLSQTTSEPPLILQVKEENITVEETVLLEIKPEIANTAIKQEEAPTPTPIPNLEMPKPKGTRKRKIYREPTSSDEEFLASLHLPEKEKEKGLDFKAMYFDLLIEYNEYKKKTSPPALASASALSLTPNFSIENFLSDPEKFEYYTGLPDYSTCQLLLNIVLGSARKTKLFCNYSISSFEYKRLSPENELFLVLVKLCHDFDYLHLAHLFRLAPGIVKNIFETWVGHMCARFKNLDIWPDRKTILTRDQRLICKDDTPFVLGSLTGVEFLLKAGKAEPVVHAKALLVTDLIGAVIFVSNLFTIPVLTSKEVETSGLNRIIRAKIENKFLYSNDVILGTAACNVRQFLEPAGNVQIPVVQMKTIEFSLPAVDNVACKVGYGECDKLVVKKAFSRLLKYKILIKTFDCGEFDVFNRVWVVCCILANFQKPETLTRVVKKHCSQY